MVAVCFFRSAINMYLNQISLTGGIPFAVTLPKSSERVNADLMSACKIQDKLKNGLGDVEKGNVRTAAEAFAEFRENQQNEMI